MAALGMRQAPAHKRQRTVIHYTAQCGRSHENMLPGALPRPLHLRRYCLLLLGAAGPHLLAAVGTPGSDATRLENGRLTSGGTDRSRRGREPASPAPSRPSHHPPGPDLPSRRSGSSPAPPRPTTAPAKTDSSAAFTARSRTRPCLRPKGKFGSPVLDSRFRVDAALVQALGRLLALKEACPDLKASENFQQLQLDLIAVKEHLQCVRRVYNGAVRLQCHHPAGARHDHCSRIGFRRCRVLRGP